MNLSPAALTVEACLALLDRAMLADRRHLARRLQNFRHSLPPAERRRRAVPAALAEELHRSIERAERRGAALPVPDYPEELPITARREEIAAAIAAHQVTIVCGETGSGKSTQLPKICLALGRGVKGMIGHTQPRRLAARTIAARVAAELKTPLGAAVGYKVRFSDQTSDRTYVKLMTDGILLAETQGDRRLEAYDTLIIDEAHERSLNIDFLLGCLKTLLPRRPDLKVIVTSATIDPQRFSGHFGGAPIIEVSGRTWPVELRYRPPVLDEDGEEADPMQGLLDAVGELSRIDRDDILVFLPGEREIRDAADALARRKLADTDVLPLYARLSSAEQQRIFAPHVRRHIVLATNLAETSLTVPGVRYVIDTGLARISRYSPRTKVQRLPIERIAQASADQRAGRCGRTADGVCIRLYAEEDYQSRPRYTDPEIKRTNLAAIILQLESLQFGAIDDFPFLDPPESRYISDGYRLLHELGAVDEARQLTPLGRQLARLPVDPRIARLILAGREEHCLEEILVIAAALSIQDPRERPHGAQAKADEAHARFNDERSDFLWFLNFWRAYEEQSRQLSRRRLVDFCHESFVAPARVREWRDTHAQLHDLAAEMRFSLNREPAQYAAIHCALLAGYLSHAALRTDAGEYLGARNNKPAIFPGSALFKRKPKWFLAAQLVETSRLYARTVAAIEPEWIEKAGAHLLKRGYSDPHWERRRGRVTAFEKVTLYGLTVVAGRKADFSTVNPPEARDIFIREALVEGELDTQAGFFHRNRALIEEIRALEHKARRLDILADGQAIFEFYDARIPENLCDARNFERWLTQIETEDPQRLDIPREYLMRAEPAAAGLFPDHLDHGELRIDLSYRFEPGHDEDGVTATIPLLALNQLRPMFFDWLVPGLIKEKVGLLIRSLPKSLRRHFVPVPQYTDTFLAALSGTALSPNGGEGRGEGEATPHQRSHPHPSPLLGGRRSGPLTETLAGYLNRAQGVSVGASDFREDVLPDHLRMNFRVADDRGQVLATGRDLDAIKRKLGDTVRESFTGDAGWRQEREGVMRWDFGDLPATVTLRKGGLSLTGYPAFEDRGDSVAIRVVDTEERARQLSRAGLRRLFMLELRQQVKYLRQNLPGFDKTSLYFSTVGGAEDLREDLIAAVYERAFMEDGEPIRTQAEFVRRRERGRAEVVGIANGLCAVVAESLQRFHDLRRELQAQAKPAWREAIAEIDEQLRALVYPGFLAATPAPWLKAYPRYLKAAQARLQKLPRDYARDRQRAAQLAAFLQRYKERRERLERDGKAMPAGLEEFRWWLEEFRVSLFAQELGTVVAVSGARLEKEWQRLAAGD